MKESSKMLSNNLNDNNNSLGFFTLHYIIDIQILC